eukprot:9503479-Pyramimonas_sp.AAC.2
MHTHPHIHSPVPAHAHTPPHATPAHDDHPVQGGPRSSDIGTRRNSIPGIPHASVSHRDVPSTSHWIFVRESPVGIAHNR